MAFFKNSEEFYDCATALFEQIQVIYPQAADDVVKAKLIIRFSCRDPEAILIINGRHNPASYAFGENRVRPEVDVQLETDTLHQILLGELRLGSALASKALKIRGPARKTLALANLFQQLREIYPQVLREQGLS